MLLANIISNYRQFQFQDYMLQYIIKRFLLGLFTVWVITVISWVIIELPPGDFVTYYVDVLLRENADSPLGRQMAETLREQLGYNHPPMLDMVNGCGTCYMVIWANLSYMNQCL